MPRKQRFYLRKIPAHLVQRGNNRQEVFFQENDYAAYLSWLKEAAERYGCAIHAYVLMTNHVHLLVTPESKDSISRMVQYVGRHYVSYINYEHCRSGTLWEGRHRGTLIDTERYLLTCYRYIELNLVRAGMVNPPAAYRWSIYQANAMREQDPRVTSHAENEQLGATPEERRKNYGELFRGSLESQQLDAIRSTLQTGTSLGNDRFGSKSRPLWRERLVI